MRDDFQPNNTAKSQNIHKSIQCGLAEVTFIAAKSDAHYFSKVKINVKVKLSLCLTN
jgi:cell division GTPase FtsZ